MIEVYKLTHDLYDSNVSNILLKEQDAIPDSAGRTRGHSQKLYKRKHRLEVRKHNFSFRVVDPWNSLPEKVISAPSLASFERKLDKFWIDQKVKYDFKKCLRITHPNNTPIMEGTGSGNESDEEKDLPIEA